MDALQLPDADAAEVYRHNPPRTPRLGQSTVEQGS
jgi:hypothetical protein